MCIKAFRKRFNSALGIEAHLLSKCCHENLPWLYGVVTDNSLKLIVMSFHGNDGRSMSLHHLLHLQSQSQSSPTLSSEQAKTVVLGLISGLKYLHNKSILHNDVKSDNIVVQYILPGASVKAILIDLGKGCYLSAAKKYHLSQKEQEEYSKNHPQIAPDLRSGHCSQSFASDVYSLGRVLKLLNDTSLHIPVISSLSSMCMEYLCSKRPTTSELFTTFRNLFV